MICGRGVRKSHLFTICSAALTSQTASLASFSPCWQGQTTFIFLLCFLYILLLCVPDLYIFFLLVFYTMCCTFSEVYLLFRKKILLLDIPHYPPSFFPVCLSCAGNICSYSIILVLITSVYLHASLNPSAATCGSTSPPFFTLYIFLCHFVTFMFSFLILLYLCVPLLPCPPWSIKSPAGTVQKDLLRHSEILHILNV